MKTTLSYNRVNKQLLTTEKLMESGFKFKHYESRNRKANGVDELAELDILLNFTLIHIMKNLVKSIKTHG